MKRSRIFGRATWLVLLVVTFQVKAAVPEEHRAAVERAGKLGDTLYVHHSASARAMNELNKRNVFKKDKRIAGWVTDEVPYPVAVIVTYIGVSQGAPQAIYRVTVPSGEGKLRFERLKKAQPLTESQRVRFAARGTAIAEFERRPENCGEYHRTTVLPIKADDAQILVYHIALTNKSRIAIVGGHVQYVVSADGGRIEGRRTFAAGCHEHEVPKAIDKGKFSALVLSHVLSQTPTELHVFLSRLHAPLYVRTGMNGLTWWVAGKYMDISSL